MQNRRDILRLRKLITIIIRLGSTANSIDCKNSYTMSWGFTVHRIGTAFSFESLALPALQWLLQWLCRLRSVISNRPNLRNENAKCWRCMGGGTGTHPVVAGALSMSLPVPRNSSDVARRQLSFSDLGKPCASLPVETRAKRAGHQTAGEVDRSTAMSSIASVISSRLACQVQGCGCNWQPLVFAMGYESVSKRNFLW